MQFGWQQQIEVFPIRLAINQSMGYAGIIKEQIVIQTDPNIIIISYNTQDQTKALMIPQPQIPNPDDQFGQIILFYNNLFSTISRGQIISIREDELLPLDQMLKKYNYCTGLVDNYYKKYVQHKGSNNKDNTNQNQSEKKKQKNSNTEKSFWQKIISCIQKAEQNIKPKQNMKNQYFTNPLRQQLMKKQLQSVQNQSLTKQKISKLQELFQKLMKGDNVNYFSFKQATRKLFKMEYIDALMKPFEDDYNKLRDAEGKLKALCGKNYPYTWQTDGSLADKCQRHLSHIQSKTPTSQPPARQFNMVPKQYKMSKNNEKNIDRKQAQVQTQAHPYPQVQQQNQKELNLKNEIQAHRHKITTLNQTMQNLQNQNNKLIQSNKQLLAKYDLKIKQQKHINQKHSLVEQELQKVKTELANQKIAHNTQIQTLQQKIKKLESQNCNKESQRQVAIIETGIKKQIKRIKQQIEELKSSKQYFKSAFTTLTQQHLSFYGQLKDEYLSIERSLAKREKEQTEKMEIKIEAMERQIGQLEQEKSIRNDSMRRFFQNIKELLQDYYRKENQTNISKSLLLKKDENTFQSNVCQILEIIMKREISARENNINLQEQNRNFRLAIQSLKNKSRI